MKPAYEIIPEATGRSFMIKLIDRPSRPRLSQAWHYHPEIEICLTLESNGKRFVGNQIADYYAEDLVLFGANLPHGFTTPSRCRQVVIQMTEDFMGERFVDAPEMHAIRSLFYRARKGLEFGTTTIAIAREIILRMALADGLKRFILLLELLTVLEESGDAEEICKQEYILDFTTTSLERIRVVYDYILENLNKEIRVKQVADMLSLTEAAFFKFFKKQANKTFIQVVNEFRINHAGKLLISTDKSIAEIAYESGYNNISFFNRTFKEIMQKTPGAFRRTYADDRR